MDLFDGFENVARKLRHRDFDVLLERLKHGEERLVLAGRLALVANGFSYGMRWGLERSLKRSGLRVTVGMPSRPSRISLESGRAKRFSPISRRDPGFWGQIG